EGSGNWLPSFVFAGEVLAAGVSARNPWKGPTVRITNLSSRWPIACESQAGPGGSASLFSCPSSSLPVLTQFHYRFPPEQKARAIDESTGISRHSRSDRSHHFQHLLFSGIALASFRPRRLQEH